MAGGEDPVKEKSTLYLPPLSGHTDGSGMVRKGAGYAEYLQDAWFYEATPRTIEGLTGLVFRRPPAVQAPSGLDAFLTDVTGSGVSFQGFAQRCIDEVQTVGRGGGLVEKDDSLPINAAFEKQPFWIFYRAENIVNWEKKRIKGKMKLVLIVLYEEEKEAQEDGFEYAVVPQYRVLDLIDLDSTPKYRQRIFRRLAGPVVRTEFEAEPPYARNRPREDEQWEQFGADIIPLVDGNTMDEIPFVFMNPMDTECEIQKPPLMGLVNANLAWYRTAASYRRGLLWAGCPTLVTMGYERSPGHEDDPIPVGSGHALELPEGGNAKYLEFLGQGLSGVRQALMDLEATMAVLGVRMLAPEKRAVETAETALIHRHGENSALGSIVGTVEEALNKMGQWTMDWMGIKGTFKAGLNRKFIPLELTPQMASEMVKAWQVGAAIALPDLHWIWQEAELVRSDRDFEVVMSDIESEQPRQTAQTVSLLNALPALPGNPAPADNTPPAGKKIPPKSSAPANKPAPKKPLGRKT